jgi:D-xylose 1-dehydrogenase (NADP+, D-xylono-1,5-lactone-forming)
MPKSLNFGILGCARIVRRSIIAGFGNTSAARLLAVASRDGRTAAAWGAEFGIPRAYDSYAALIADPDVDAVYIPLPNELHREWALAAAAAGKHVLCEKPLGLDATDAQAIVDGCRRHGVVLMEAFMWRHHPRVAHARRMLAEGRLGELRLVKMDFSFDIDRTDWRLDPQRGGGALWDIGCYGVNAARLFTAAEPLEVFSRAHRYSTGVDMTLGMSLRFPGDVLALLDCSFECPTRNRIELVGTLGALEFPEGVLPPPESRLVFRHAGGVEIVEFPAADQYARQLEDFCAAVESGSLNDPAEDGLANMRVLDAIRHAASS